MVGVEGPVVASGAERPAYAPPVAAGANEAVADDPGRVYPQSLVERVNAYGYNPQLVTFHPPQRRMRVVRALAGQLLSVVLVVWLAYFTITVALHLDVWPF